jgi:hypothetical protein
VGVSPESLPLAAEQESGDLELDLEAAPEQGQGDAQALVLQYIEELRQQQGQEARPRLTTESPPQQATQKAPMWEAVVPEIPIPPAPNPRHAYRSLAIAGVLLVAALCATPMLLLPAAETTAFQESVVCAQRQEAIMDAIAWYTRKHNEAPSSLSVLGRPYLKVPPVDPTSGQPYQYVRQGNAVWLSCPKHPLPPHAPQP